jgi:hypothetical protein
MKVIENISEMKSNVNGVSAKCVWRNGEENQLMAINGNGGGND